MMLRTIATLLVLVTNVIIVVEAAYDTIDGHSCFRNLQGITESMFDLATQYPNLSTINDIGDSYLKDSGTENKDYDLGGGFDIYAMNITSSDADGSHLSSTKGKVLIIAGVHPREFAPPEIVMRFAETLLQGYGIDSDITWILQHTEIHLIFNVNPDGRYVTENYQAEFWRKNLNPEQSKECKADDIGIDLNRNYDFNFGDTDGASDDPCDNTYHGRNGNSEPETQAVVNYARDLFPESQRKDDPMGDKDLPLGEDVMGIFIDVHTPGGYVFYPWGIGDVSENDDAFQAMARKFSYFNGYRLWAPGHPDFLYAIAGDSTDYMYGVLGVPSLGLELGEDFYEDCDLFEDVIVPDNIPVFMYIAATAKRPFHLSKGPDILDLSVSQIDTDSGMIRVEVTSSDSVMVNRLGRFNDYDDDFATGRQGVSGVQIYMNVHPDDFEDGDTTWAMDFISDDEGEHLFELEMIPPGESGLITLYARAMDTEEYVGPATSTAFNVEKRITASPSQAPTSGPSPAPTKKPTSPPTSNPSKLPTLKPSAQPTSMPTSIPTGAPSASPSDSPTTLKPSLVPTDDPTNSPSFSALPTTGTPTAAPVTAEPTNVPSSSPTTAEPSISPTINPTRAPSSSPTTAKPSASPTTNPSGSPTPPVPTSSPVQAPTDEPTSSSLAFGPGETDPIQQQNVSTASSQVPPVPPTSNASHCMHSFISITAVFLSVLSMLIL